MFKRRFVICFVLAIPVLIYSPFIQDLLGFTAPTMPGSEFIAPVFGIVVLVYGGVPFLRMATTEARNREPGIMMLVSLAITVAFVYSIAAFFLGIGETFFWELSWGIRPSCCTSRR
ncbi:copper-exporting P-type ATPase B [Halalkalicoccus paucihalophilus]|uniref:Copper-exporting P-type ATPase B n=1 Tax=Halalkalicoccus paucihalophilus TaxID=1008153 RepID=A0A151A8Q7_9EURY|nr:copper-exporting P-type ATPase B [Halalkalicoccus paucihalophilus]